MLLFIFSEVMFFFGFFWAFFNNRVNPDRSLGLTYPSFGLKSINPIEVPLLNTLILLSSGRTVTISHHFLLKNKDCALSLAMTVILGLYFTSLQLIEYINSTFRISDSVYGRRFFVITGFHGLHVMVGTLFLLVCLFRILQKHITYNHHFGYEASIWY
jgi:heme/copper-type cytochrome/quinol oxidase subunit 3